MNTRSFSRRVPEETTVISKYFKPKKQMDESLLDFKECKKLSKAKKEVKKAPAAKKQQKRTTKKEKGQKDIRTALKSKRDDLVSYTKEFQNVCLESGVDIDSEQLQLAIALSKSLQQENHPEPSTSHSLNNECLRRNRSNKIRSTLLEYGFSVPEIKKTAVKRRPRKYRKNSKLLLATDEEKKQKVADKLSQILFESCTDANISKTTDTSLHTDAETNFYKLTGQTFDLLKDDKCFYTTNLLEFGPNTVGSLLKDWSEIPGRPISPPPVAVDDRHFTEFIDNHDDLDVLLSSTMNVVKRLVDALKREKELEGPKEDVKDEIIIANDVDLKDNLENTINKPESFHINHANNLKIKDTLKIIVPEVERSCSPDLFEDETDDISISKSVPLSEASQSLKGHENIPPITSLLADHMSNEPQTDMTKICVNDCIDANQIDTKEIFKNVECKIDLTEDQNETMQNSLPASPEICVDDDIEEVDDIKSTQNSQTYDLTQSSESSSDSLPDVHLTNQCEKISKTSFNIFLPSQECTEKGAKCEFKCSEIKNSDCDFEIDPYASNGGDIDLTQESSSPEVVTHTFSSNIEISTNKSGLFDDFTFHHSSLSENNSSKELTLLQDIEFNRETSNHEEQINWNDKINLTQQVDNVVVGKVNFDSNKTNNDLVNDAISLDSSNDSTKEKEDKTIEYGDYDGAQIEPVFDKETMVDDIDLKNNHEFDGKTERIQEIADMTIELDSTVDENVSYVNVIPKITSSSSKENSTNVEQNGDVLATSQCSENVFEISDEELDYSMQYFRKCKQNSSKYSNQGTPIKQHENANFDLGGSSILDLIPSNRPSSSICFTPTIYNSRRSENFSYDSFLPAVEIKGTKVKIKSPEPTDIPGTSSTPVRKSEVCNVVTPGNTEYIVKTSNVTPMLDYAALDTPQVNKELDKYGIKPFKRKRAIQLLEHIYNQTHPIVEKCDLDNQETPAKRPKLNKESPKTNSADLENLSQELESNLIENKAECDDSSENINIYKVDLLSPHLKNVPCSSEDWIFQKKEKAKVHSCKVPLHIAFHNYVNARSLIREAILRYEPISIDIIHKQLVKDGHRYDPKDLLKFMDKKCITVKTADNNSRNGIKRYQGKG